MAEKAMLVVTNEKETPIKTMEAEVKVEYKYKDEGAFTEVLKEDTSKGVISKEEGEWPAAATGKTIDERKVTITPKNYAFYAPRNYTKIYREELAQKEGGKPGEKFALEPVKERTMQDRIDGATSAIDQKISKA